MFCDTHRLVEKCHTVCHIFPTVHSIVFGVKQQRCYNVLVQLIVAKLSSVGKL